jgi:hypothetical protein
MNGLLIVLGSAALIAAIIFKEHNAYLCGVSCGLFFSSIIVSFFPKEN